MTRSSSADDEHLQIARTVRQACIEAAKSGFETADMSGLCREGAIEAAISAIEMLDLAELLK